MLEPGTLAWTRAGGRRDRWEALSKSSWVTSSHHFLSTHHEPGKVLSASETPFKPIVPTSQMGK